MISSTVYLLLGSNMGNSKIQLAIAQQKIMETVGKIVDVSEVYKTAAWGNENQPDFLNQVLIITTRKSPSLLIKQVLAVEKAMGRVRTIKNAPRVIDIDVLFFNNEIIDTKKLIVPHPEIQNRRFVLVPLVELDPKLIHPLLNKTVTKLLKECKDKLNVQKI
jgi:2-amino-4-hydroxy-6-hydroxymethyldihydropteridine diphosphokinase